MTVDAGARMLFEPTRESLRQHVVPDWFAGAKLGLMIHWGPHSVPGWAERSSDIQDLWAEKGAAYQFKHTPYAEWYENTIRIAGSAAQHHHVATYGQDFPYERFGAQFAMASATTDFTPWADLFARAGARYAVLTAKHMDGYLLWPSRHPNPRNPSFQSTRDLVGDLAQAVRARGLKMGLYYCGGYDATFNTTVVQDLLSAITAIPPAHADYTAPEYEVRAEISKGKWESVRGIGYSFGNNREERDDDLPSGAELVRLLADIVSKNGNLLLGIGPTADGEFPNTQTRRLAEVGDWLAVNGEAIYDTRPWVRAEGRTADGLPVRFTRNDDAVFVIMLGRPPGAKVVIESVHLGEDADMRLLGVDGALPCERTGNGLALALPDRLPPSPAYAFRISPATSVRQ